MSHSQTTDPFASRSRRRSPLRSPRQGAPRPPRAAAAPAALEPEPEPALAPPAQRYLNTRAAAVYLGSTVKVLEYLRSVNDGPPYSRIGRQVRYDLADLDAYMRASRVEPAR